MAYDVIIVGVGAMGVQAAFHLARRGKRVLALDRFEIGHNHGSSHGEHRIIRLAYFEHPLYVPLLQRAFALWHELETLAGEQLFFRTGALDIGQESDRLVQGALRSCSDHGLIHEVLSASELMHRYPAYKVPNDYAAVLQPDGGFLACERTIAVTAKLARALGVEVRTNQSIDRISMNNEGGVRVHAQGHTFEVDTVILAAGAWMQQLLPEFSDLMVPERQVLGWFKPKNAQDFAPQSFPVSNILSDLGHHYQLPMWKIPGVKIGLYHHRAEQGAAEELPREITETDIEVLRAGLKRFMPDANGELVHATTCLFTNTPDGHFLLGEVPKLPGVIAASACSGHGFKFSPLIGELLADIAMDKRPAFDLAPFGFARFDS